MTRFVAGLLAVFISLSAVAAENPVSRFPISAAGPALVTGGVSAMAGAAARFPVAAEQQYRQVEVDLEPDQGPVEDSLWAFDVGPLAYYERYREYSVLAGGKKVMQETAPMYGVKLGATRAVPKLNARLVWSGEYAHGKASYTGSYMGGQYGDLRIAELPRSALDTTITYKQGYRNLYGVVTNLGLGYRHLTDHLEKAGKAGYQRENKLFYMTVGVERSFVGDGWAVIPSLQYKRLLKGSQSSDLPFGEINVKQHRGQGYELSVSFARRVGAYEVAATPFVRGWHIRDSSVSKEGFYEPDNKTTEVGASIIVRF